jgi:hypothetical protein
MNFDGLYASLIVIAGLTVVMAVLGALAAIAISVYTSHYGR